MPKILDRLPIPARDDVVFVSDERVPIKTAEIVVWVSVSVESNLGWNPELPRFPAILDTGHTHNFSIQEEQLIRWVGIRPDLLRVLGRVRQAATPGPAGHPEQPPVLGGRRRTRAGHAADA